MRELKKVFWPHKISVTVIEDPNPDAIEIWLGQNMGQFRGRWNAVYYHDHTDYYFRDARDATVFALRWS